MTQFVVIVEGETPSAYGPFRHWTKAKACADRWNNHLAKLRETNPRDYGDCYDTARIHDIYNPATITDELPTI